jgi:uracil-DNA glycosylase
MINTWHEKMQVLFATPKMQEISDFLTAQTAMKKVIFPPNHLRYKAFELTPFNQVKVIILGQDPYHNPNQAHGLSFSVPDGVKIPPSLRNIYQELQKDLGISPAKNGNLESWAKQGVLLLNTSLSVEKNTPNSHANIGWDFLTNNIIELLSEQKQHLVFVLWGAFAQKKIPLIDVQKHTILTATHPSPFSAHRGFFGCRHFSKINQCLEKYGEKPIKWML